MRNTEVFCAMAIVLMRLRIKAKRATRLRPGHLRSVAWMEAEASLVPSPRPSPRRGEGEMRIITKHLLRKIYAIACAHCRAHPHRTGSSTYRRAVSTAKTPGHRAKANAGSRRAHRLPAGRYATRHVRAASRYAAPG